MSTVNEKMTALADEVRELSGTTSTKSIDAMTNDVHAANAEIADQTDLIEQIISAVDELPEVSGDTNLTNTVYIGTTEPTNDIGTDGDIYIVRW